MAAVSAAIDVSQVTALQQESRLRFDEDPQLAIWDMLSGKHSMSASDGQPARKKQKLDHETSKATQLLDSYDGSRSIVLAKVQLDLRFSPEQVSSELTPRAFLGTEEPLVVSLNSFSRQSKKDFTMSLSCLTTPSEGVHVACQTIARSLDDIAPLLDRIEVLAQAQLGRKRPLRTGASFCRCTLTAPTSENGHLRLDVQIRWLKNVSSVETLGRGSAQRKTDMHILSKYCLGGAESALRPWALSDFYDSVHVPSSDLEISPQIQQSLTETTLYPFQQRAVNWLLEREHVSLSSTSATPVPFKSSKQSLPVSFSEIKDADQEICYVSGLRGMVISSTDAIPDYSQMLRGGILAEEMGLGKTVELIALMMLNRRQKPEAKIFDAYVGADVRPTAATLIISPPSILEQWKSEIKSHAPGMRVLHYKGLPPNSASKETKSEATVEHLMQFDVVLTTYNVLSREIHFAKPPPDRFLRHKKARLPPKSPLVELSWWRVVLDEAQMVESGVSQAAEVARIIPRHNAWAVSGTPLRKDVQDLRGLLTFLRLEPFAGSKNVWDRLDKPSFSQIFRRIALRHTKDKVRDELRLPPQKRVVITIPFTAIEEQNYTEMIKQMCEACGLSPEGLPLKDGHDADHPDVIEKMRAWLVRLRQTCLHAHVGRRNRKALGAKNTPLRTVHEVLEVMIDQNDTTLKAEAREVILARIRLGHIKGNAGDDEERSRIALSFYLDTLPDAQSYVQTCRDELRLEKERVGIANDIDQESNIDEDSESQEVGRVPVLQKALRSFLELEHACKFFIGTAYFQIKSNETLTAPDSPEFHAVEKQETEAYDDAKKIRKELLRDSERKATKQMEKIRSNVPFSSIENIEDLPDLGGIEGKRILEMMDNVADILNAQSSEVVKYRQKVLDILLLPLVDEDEGKETTGDEYEDSTKVQDQLYVYVMALRTLVADRQALVSGLVDLLTEHEVKAAYSLATNAEDDEQGRGHAPELVLEFVEARHKIKPTNDIGSLKGVVSATRSLLTNVQWKADGGDTRADAELVFIQRQLAKIQHITAIQSKTIAELEKELEVIRAAMNQRLEFYRQLQNISDTVAPWRDELDPQFRLDEYQKQQNKLAQSQVRLDGCKRKQNYLTNLRKENEQSNSSHKCIICLDEFDIGVLTTCGHKYCKDCINQWWHAHRTCPMCKVKLRSSDFRDITLKPKAMVVQEDLPEEESPSQTCSSSASGTFLYSDLSDATMKEIKGIDLDGSYGSKVDMLARHLLWIRNNDPGAKSIIFSQFSDFLEVLREALRKWKIGASSIGDKNGIVMFKTDPAVECFLLDAKSDSSGLNLVNATYVFLCEPLINPAIELQAIARVHRIGQQRPTTVFMYLVSDTVEEAIYDISVARRLEHMGKRSRSGTATPILQEKTIEAANSHEMEAAPLKGLLRKKGDGEVVQVDDLWRCLFGKPRGSHRAVLDREVGRHLRADAVEGRAAM